MKRVIVFAVTTGFLLAGFSGVAFAKPFHHKKPVQATDEKDKDVKVKENKKDKKHKGKSKKY